MYQSPAAAAIANPTAQINTDPRAIQEHFEDFYEDIFEELAKFGELEGLNVCDNTSDHLIGNVYVKFREEESALAALNALSGRFYSGRPILCEFSPVTDFRESTCRQYEEQTCNRGGYCNFMHLKPISRQLRKILFGRYKRRDDDRGDGTIITIDPAGTGAAAGTTATTGAVHPGAVHPAAAAGTMTGAAAAAGRTVGAAAATTIGGATGLTTEDAGTTEAAAEGATEAAIDTTIDGGTTTGGTTGGTTRVSRRRACRTRTGARCSPSGTRTRAAGTAMRGARKNQIPRTTTGIADRRRQTPRVDAGYIVD